LGFERPAQLGALFIADARQLRELTEHTEPLTDNYPKRLGDSPTFATDRAELRAWMAVSATARRFRDSSFIREAWPAALRARTLSYFESQGILNSILIDGAGPDYSRLHRILTESALRSPVLWDLGLIDLLPAVEALPAGQSDNIRYLGIRAGGALAERDFSRAADLYHRARTADPARPLFWKLEIYSLCMAGRIDEAREVASAAVSTIGADPIGRPYWRSMREWFGLGGF
jgi:hypothetical protein